MRKRLGGCLWYLIGICIALVWVLADILTNNPINKLNPFNDAVLIILIAASAAYINWQSKKSSNVRKQKIAMVDKKWTSEEDKTAAGHKGGSISRRNPKKIARK